MTIVSALGIAMTLGILLYKTVIPISQSYRRNIITQNHTAEKPYCREIIHNSCTMEGDITTLSRSLLLQLIVLLVLLLLLTTIGIVLGVAWRR